MDLRERVRSGDTVPRFPVMPKHILMCFGIFLQRKKSPDGLFLICCDYLLSSVAVLSALSSASDSASEEAEEVVEVEMLEGLEEVLPETA